MYNNVDYALSDDKHEPQAMTNHRSTSPSVVVVGAADG